MSGVRFSSSDRESIHPDPDAEMDLDRLRRRNRRYQGDNPYRTLERIRSRLVAAGKGSLQHGSVARAESGHMAFAAQLRRRRTKRHGARGWHAPDDIRKLYDDQGARCFYCGAELNDCYVVDHKTPLTRGGSDWPENLCCACDYCASHKGERTAEEFFAYLAGLRRRRP